MQLNTNTNVIEPKSGKKHIIIIDVFTWVLCLPACLEANDKESTYIRMYVCIFGGVCPVVVAHVLHVTKNKKSYVSNTKFLKISEENFHGLMKIHKNHKTVSLISFVLFELPTQYKESVITSSITDTLTIIIIIIVDTITSTTIIIHSTTLTVTRWTLVVLQHSID